MALIFIVAGVIGLLVTILALRSRQYRDLTGRYAAASVEVGRDGELPAPSPDSHYLLLDSSELLSQDMCYR